MKELKICLGCILSNYNDTSFMGSEFKSTDGKISSIVVFDQGGLKAPQTER